MKNIVIDVEKTLGDLYHIGHDPVHKYIDNKRTDEVIGYSYHLASSVQGDKVSVKVLGSEKELVMMEQVELVDVDVRPYAQVKANGFGVVNYSITAQDIKGKGL
jgi:Bacterial protein of unknown function (DUF961)